MAINREDSVYCTNSCSKNPVGGAPHWSEQSPATGGKCR